jgi:CRISPR-associated protein Csd1
MPETVFSGLFKTAIAHLGKAGRQGRKGAQIAISRRLSELSRLLIEAGGIPATLSMEQQADFALGYWDERQARFQRSEAHPNGTSFEEEE